MPTVVVVVIAAAVLLVFYVLVLVLAGGIKAADEHAARLHRDRGSPFDQDHPEPPPPS